MTAWDSAQELMDSPLLERHGVDQQLVAQAREVWRMAQQVHRRYAEQIGWMAVCMLADALDDATYEQMRDEGLDAGEIADSLGGVS